jgi:hypothetical protein
MATAQVAAPQEEREFRAVVDRLLDETKVRPETQQLTRAYRHATYSVEAALKEHLNANPRAPLALVEAARMLRIAREITSAFDYAELRAV